jgi:hypothetical protein
MPASALRNCSTSSAVVAAPIETRSAPPSSPWPIAFSTWLGPTLPDEQAEPADKATPARSKAICTVSALAPGDSEERRIGKAFHALSENFGVRHQFGHDRLDGITPLPDNLDIGKSSQPFACGSAKTGNGGKVLRAAAMTLLLAAAA